MLEESLVVSSALSAFNNAALVAPAFLWNAVLCIPLFAVVFWFGRFAAPKLGITPYITLPRATFWTIMLTALWCIFMGGNYAALRDEASFLPWIMATILFVSTMFVAGATRAIKLPMFIGATAMSTKQKQLVYFLLGLIILLPVAASYMQNLFAGAIQIGAIFIGFLMGRFVCKNVRSVLWMLLIMLGVTIAVLMQPEFFRFGQLGNLSPMHLIWVLATGLALATAFALNTIHPCGRVHNSAYIKIKWLLRLVVVLAGVLFLLTESVPMFIATVLLFFVMAALSIWHTEKIAMQIPDWAVAASIILFGILVGIQTITCIGILLIASTNNSSKHVPWFLL